MSFISIVTELTIKKACANMLVKMFSSQAILYFEVDWNRNFNHYVISINTVENFN